MKNILLFAFSFIFIFSLSGCNNKAKSGASEALSLDSREEKQIYNDPLVITLAENSNFTLKALTSSIVRTENDIRVPLRTILNHRSLVEDHIKEMSSLKDNPSLFYSEPDAIDRFGYSVSYVRFDRRNKIYTVEMLEEYENDGSLIHSVEIPETERVVETIEDGSLYATVWNFLHRKVKIEADSEVLEMYIDQAAPIAKSAVKYKIIQETQASY